MTALVAATDSVSIKFVICVVNDVEFNSRTDLLSYNFAV